MAPTPSGLAHADEQAQSHTESSATSSDNGTESFPEPETSDMLPSTAAQLTYQQLRAAEKIRCRYTDRPTCTFRRLFKANQDRGRGKMLRPRPCLYAARTSERCQRGCLPRCRRKE